ncbi:hypothetical protein PHMEG_00010178 [Phytophthora megakarya]|uniref:SET domain-containing protein n=1 Tax=Phytophthora megakarya TaxID=4795 RepID=A0A225WEC4_9STRA|nr:hypothetical protein PHMEG_00010178 [Phytophthora megakarya]
MNEASETITYVGLTNCSCQMQVECIRGNCHSGLGCSNQQMQDRATSELSVKKHISKGIALFAGESIWSGDFVCEYTGEVITRQEYRLRASQLVGATNYYGVVGDNDEIIDARNFGSVARFANHSCQPNCVLERWDVCGETCCGLFARVDIASGDEITFDYGASGRIVEVWILCRCSTTQCRGYVPG